MGTTSTTTTASASEAISIRKFRCEAGHKFTASVKVRVERSSSSGRDEPLKFYRVHTQYGADSSWLPIPKCPVVECVFIGSPEIDELTTRPIAQIPAGERFFGWLSADGERLAVPGYSGARMPERYRRAGYVAVEAGNLQDLDRLMQVREKQTGNYSYTQSSTFDSATLRELENAPPSDDMKSEM